MLLVCGFPATRPAPDAPLGAGTLWILVKGVLFWVETRPTTESVESITLGGAPLPPDAEMWFESASERSH